MIMRVASGLFGVLFIVGMIASFLDGSFPIHGPHALTMLLMPFAFLLYAFGGQKLIQKLLPMFAHREEQKTKNDEDKKA